MFTEVGFDYIFTFIDLVTGTFSNLMSYLNYSLREILGFALDSSEISWLFEWVMDSDWAILDIPLYGFLIGAGITVYVCYQLVIWVLNIIT